VALVALGVWLANDHWLHADKLSELSVLVVLPLLVASLVNLGLPERFHARVVDAVIIATGIAFVLAKLWEPANRLLASVFGELDASDLIALPMLVVSRWCYRRSRPVTS